MEQLVARWAHNPKVIRSSRVSATIEDAVRCVLFLCCRVALFAGALRTKVRAESCRAFALSAVSFNKALLFYMRLQFVSAARPE